MTAAGSGAVGEGSTEVGVEFVIRKNLCVGVVTIEE